MIKDKYGNYVIQKIIMQASKSDILAIQEAVNKSVQGEKKLNGYTKHVLKLIKRRLE